MPRKKVQETPEADTLEIQEGSPGAVLPEENPDAPPQEEAPAAEENAEALDETSRLLAELDGGDPAAGRTLPSRRRGRTLPMPSLPSVGGARLRPQKLRRRMTALPSEGPAPRRGAGRTAF